VAIRAVLWDFGGVITTSPFDAFLDYERSLGVPDGLIRSINATNPDANAWAQLERSEVDLDQFCALFEAEHRRWVTRWRDAGCSPASVVGSVPRWPRPSAVARRASSAPV